MIRLLSVLISVLFFSVLALAQEVGLTVNKKIYTISVKISQFLR